MELDPLQVRPLIYLTNLGINQQSIKFNSVSIPSHRYICIKEQNEIKMLDMTDLTNVNVNNIPVRAAQMVCMHPEQNILCIANNKTMQVFKMGGNAPEQIASATLQEDVRHWSWITSTTMAVVTDTTVFHWAVATGGQPDAVFTRDSQLAGHQIISYKISPNEKWAILVGIASKNGIIAGNMQLWSFEKKVAQVIEGHAADFYEFKFPESNEKSTVLCFAQKKANDSKLYIIEVNQKKGKQLSVPLFSSQSSPDDFPVAMHANVRYSVIYLITKEGFVNVYDLSNGRALYSTQIAQEGIFVSTKNTSNNGFVCISLAGAVFSCAINEQTLVPYIMNTLQDMQTAVSIATRAGLPGAESIYMQQFQTFWQQGRYLDAGRVAAESPRGVLRTPEVLKAFSSLPPPQQGAPLVYQYLNILLEKGKLNEHETTELCFPAFQQGRVDLLKKWLSEDKLECTRELGDMAKAVDLQIALSIYYRAKATDKVIEIFAETGQYEQMVNYTRQENITPNWLQLIANLLDTNSSAASSLSKMILMSEGSTIDINQLINLFVSKMKIQEINDVLLEMLAENKTDDGPMQTKLLEINIQNAPKIADVMLSQKMFTQFDKQYIARLCEQAGLSMRALELYETNEDIMKVMENFSGVMEKNFAISFFSLRDVQTTMQCLRLLMQNHQNLDTVVVVGAQFTPNPSTVESSEGGKLTPDMMVELFEEFDSDKGLYQYLKLIIGLWSGDAELVFKYIQSAVKCKATSDIEVAINSYNYDPIRVREMLKDAGLSDQRPLVLLCDKHGYIADLTHYLYRHNMIQFIEAYVTNINSKSLPLVVGALLDDDCPDTFIQKLIHVAGADCDVDELVDEIEKRNKLTLLQGWLEQRYRTGTTDQGTHNALAKILILTNKEASVNFLQTNDYYNFLKVGQFCEKQDPHLAVIAYSRGQCDDELINLTNKQSLFKQQARYLVLRGSEDLWAKILSDNNEYKHQIIDEVVHTALPECDAPEPVGIAVKSFMTADLPNELIELLEKIVLYETAKFAGNKYLENLLLLTAIKADQTRVSDYIQRLDSYDPPEIAHVAIEAELFEDALSIYKKFNLSVDALKVLTNYINDSDRATTYAEETNTAEVWIVLGNYQLDRNEVENAIASYIKANYYKNNLIVINKAKAAGLFVDLGKYLTMCRQQMPEPSVKVDTELVYAMAKTDRLSHLESFIQNTKADLQAAGDLCIEEGMLEAAKIIFTRFGNFARLTTTLIRMGQYAAAIDAAKASKSISTWREVNRACLEVGEFQWANQAGQFLITQADEMEELCKFYEHRGYHEELISLLEYGIGNSRDPSSPLCTQLAVLYSKYQPTKLMQHLKLFGNQVYVQKVVTVLEENEQWKEVVLILDKSGDKNKAAKTIMAHPEEFEGDARFREVIVGVTQPEIFYTAINFYIEIFPGRLKEFMQLVTPNLDPAKVVTRVKRFDHLPLVKDYLQSVQGQNISIVNDALNDLYIEEDDPTELRRSIDMYDNFDNITLASKLRKTKSVEFKKIGVELYVRNERWEEALKICKAEQFYEEAMNAAALARSGEMAEDLLEYFVVNGNSQCFSACLYTCYDLIRPDVPLFLAWKHNMMDFAFPYMIQVVREFSQKVDKLETELENVKNHQASQSFGHEHFGPEFTQPTFPPHSATPPPSFGQPPNFPTQNKPPTSLPTGSTAPSSIDYGFGV